MIEYHNPEAQTEIEQTPYQLSASIAGAGNVSIGLLANGFPDSEAFLAELAVALHALEPGIDAQAYNKGNASIPAPDSMLAEIKGNCTALVAAYGH